MSDKFEILAKLHGLDVTKNDYGYAMHTTEICHAFYDSRQKEIDKLEHDLASANCAARMFKHVLDNPVKQNIEEGTPA